MLLLAKVLVFAVKRGECIKIQTCFKESDGSLFINEWKEGADCFDSSGSVVVISICCTFASHHFESITALREAPDPILAITQRVKAIIDKSDEGEAVFIQ